VDFEGSWCWGGHGDGNCEGDVEELGRSAK
jgi:hypothetical protein